MPGFRQWLRSSCVLHVPDFNMLTPQTVEPWHNISVGSAIPHFSHMLHCFGGVFFCKTCGFYGKQLLRKLNHQCTCHMSVHGQRAVASFMKSKFPPNCNTNRDRINVPAGGGRFPSAKYHCATITQGDIDDHTPLDQVHIQNMLIQHTDGIHEVPHARCPVCQQHQPKFSCQYLDIFTPSDSDVSTECDSVQYPDSDDLAALAQPSTSTHLDNSFEDPFEQQFNADSDALDFLGLTIDFGSHTDPPTVGIDL